MHVSDQRFDLTKSDKSGIEAFKRWIFYNSELCSHCFSRVRSVGDTVSVSMAVHTHEINKFYERTETGSQEYTRFDTNKRYGTCFCENCGSDLQPAGHQVPWEKLREFAVNIYQYTTEHTPLHLDREKFSKTVAHLKLDRRDTQGKEGQILAVAFARSLTTDITPSGTVPERAKA